MVEKIKAVVLAFWEERRVAIIAGVVSLLTAILNAVLNPAPKEVVEIHHHLVTETVQSPCPCGK